MNNKFVDRIKLMFVDKDNSVEPCLSVAQLLQAGVKEEALKTADPKTPCLAFNPYFLPVTFDLITLNCVLICPSLRNLLKTYPVAMLTQKSHCRRYDWFQ